MTAYTRMTKKQLIERLELLDRQLEVFQGAGGKRPGQLPEGEQRYLDILENIHEAYFETDLAGNYTFVNGAVSRILGHSREELLCMNIRESTSPEMLEKAVLVFQEVYRTGAPADIEEYRIIGRDGRPRIRKLRISLRRSSAGDPIGFRGVSRDVTQQVHAERALEESEERYRRILEEIDDGYWEIDLEGRFTFFNDAMCRISKKTKEELMGLKASEDATPETAERMYKAFKEVYLTGTPAELADYEIIRGDGTTGVFEMSTSLVRDKEGNPVGFRGITRDVTERKQAERALRDSEERYRTILESIEEGYFEIDLAGNYTFVNDALCRIMGGYRKEEIIGMNNRAYTDSRTARKAFSIFSEVYETGRSANIKDYEVTKKDGSIGIRELHVSLMRDYEGKPIGFRGISRDVTERRRAERALQESEERYRTILEDINEGYFETDLRGTITFANNAAARILGFAPDELVGMKNIEHRDPATAKRVASIFNAVYRTGQHADIADYETIAKDGSHRILNMHISLMRNAEGKPVGYRGLSRDATEQVKAEQALKESQERYRNLFEKTGSPIMITDPEGHFIDWNEAALAFLECTREELTGKNVHDFLPPEVRKSGAGRKENYWRRDRTMEAEYLIQGRIKVLELSMTPAVLNGSDVVFGVGKDITERKQTEEKLAYMATHDQLTGLPNRTLFNDRLEHELARSRRDKRMLAVILFDLDRFKEVNDTLGHSVGDLLLKELGGRLKGCLRHSDTVARMGGDEFFMLLCDITGERDADVIAEKILETIREPFMIERHKINITASLGVAFYPNDGGDVETLVKKADIAMYQTKGSGRDQYRHYDSSEGSGERVS